MTKENIEKKINAYTRNKLIIVNSLIISIFVLCICVILNLFLQIECLAYLALFAYLVLFVMILIGGRFTINEPLKQTITEDEYKEILKYLSNIPNDISTQKYYDGLFMIKITLNEMVYHHINEMNDLYRDHLCYLQSVFLGDNKTSFVSPKILNKFYLKNICATLLQQMNKGKFNESELADIELNDKKVKSQIHITTKDFKNLLNAILIFIVMIKIIITLNENWYNSVNLIVLGRIMYNTSVDMIALFLAIIALREK